ncbi:hypothetical protein [Haloferula sp. BvORR071]|uniref:hypothetical protein n=1 Tax=Haloferula sp. BvORR071 TaxID=1396141 RepID=UPI000553EAE5|nr:hypothetical protein [Haloferula sp. BvORR071]
MRAILVSGGYDRPLLDRINLSPRVKIALVAGGYLLAIGSAFAVVVCRLLAMSALGIARVDSGMAAFSDFLLFLAVFGIAAVLPTAAALWFLRPYPAFWRGYSIVGLAFASVALIAFVTWFFGDSTTAIAAIAFFRILFAPLFTLAFLLSGVFAPQRRARLCFLAATVMELTAIGGWIITCLIRNV